MGRWIILLCLGLVYMAGNDYYGMRIAKSCKSMLRDSLELGKDIHKILDHVEIANLTDSQGDWWSRRTLKLTLIRSQRFVHDNTKFQLDSCNAWPTGYLRADASGTGFVWETTFAWEYDFMGLTPYAGGTGTVTISSSKVEFVQSYLDGIPDTNVHVAWKLTNMQMEGFFNLVYIQDWARSMLASGLSPHLTLKLNMNMQVISNNIIKTYTRILVPNFAQNVAINNTLSLASSASYHDISYLLLNYHTGFYESTQSFAKQMQRAINTSIASIADTSFDYQVCYNVQLFGDYFEAVLKTGPPITITRPQDYGLPNTTGYYSALVPELNNRYSRPQPIKVVCSFTKTRTAMHIRYTGTANRRLLLPFTCEFTVAANNEVFLALDSVYNVSYSIKAENAILSAVLGDIMVYFVDTKPRVDPQAYFMVTELGDKLGRLLDQQVIKSPGGFHVDTVRAEELRLIGLEERFNDVCLLYAEKQP